MLEMSITYTSWSFKLIQWEQLISFLFQGLEDNVTLRHLNVHNIGISDNEAPIIAQVHKTNNSLQTFDITSMSSILSLWWHSAYSWSDSRISRISSQREDTSNGNCLEELLVLCTWAMIGASIHSDNKKCYVTTCKLNGNRRCCKRYWSSSIWQTTSFYWYSPTSMNISSCSSYQHQCKPVQSLY